MSDAEKVQKLREAFGPNGSYAVCDDDACYHGECDAGRYVLSVVGES